MRVTRTRGSEPPTELTQVHSARDLVVLVSRVTSAVEPDEDTGGRTVYTYDRYELSDTEYSEVENGYEGDVPVLRLVRLRALLARTDYVVTKIAEAAVFAPEEVEALRERYASVVADRVAWRAEVDAIERAEGLSRDETL